MAPMASAIEHGTYTRIRLLRPFIDWRKEEIVARGRQLQVDFFADLVRVAKEEFIAGVAGLAWNGERRFSSRGWPTRPITNPPAHCRPSPKAQTGEISLVSLPSSSSKLKDFLS